MPIFVETTSNKAAQKRLNLTRADKQWIDDFRRELTERFPGLVEQVLIYGSKARGEGGPDSDLDVLLLVRDEAAKRKRAMRDIGYLLAADGAVVPSIMAYTVQEWENRRKSGFPISERGRAGQGACVMKREIVLAAWRRARDSMRAAEVLARKKLFGRGVANVLCSPARSQSCVTGSRGRRRKPRGGGPDVWIAPGPYRRDRERMGQALGAQSRRPLGS